MRQEGPHPGQLLKHSDHGRQSGGKGKGQGKGKQGGGSGLANLGEEAPGANQADGGITLSCLTREIACVNHPMLYAVSNKPSSGQWGGGT